MVHHDETEHMIDTTTVVIGVGSETKVPPIDGIDTILTWTNKEATSTRDLPPSLLVLGGGPTSVELAQVFARFDVPVTLVQSGARLLPADHPRNGEAARPRPRRRRRSPRGAHDPRPRTSPSVARQTVSHGRLPDGSGSLAFARGSTKGARRTNESSSSWATIAAATSARVTRAPGLRRSDSR